MSKNEEYLSSMEAQMAKWDKDFDALSAQGEAADVAARASVQENLKELRASREAAQKTFKEIRVATEAAAAEMHAGMAVAWETMQKALDKVSADLKK